MQSYAWPWIIATVTLWWSANAITSIVSKSIMTEAEDSSPGYASRWTQAFQDLRWIDLTAIQLLLRGAVAMIWNTWWKRPRHVEINWRFAIVAAAGNLAGNLATNAAYAAVNTSHQSL